MTANNSLRQFIRKNHVALFFASWTILNLLQAGLTELFDDEAYYWVYSRYLDWGYFDHPPMIALMIKIGYFFFKNELGVRLLVVLSGTATLYIVRKLLPEKNDRLFYAICCCMALLQIGGIIAVPDIPLMFFTAIFFLAYKKFLLRMSLANTIALAFVVALMLYSKYHGVLIVFFTLLSWPALFTKYQSWLCAIIAALLFAPHIYWQVAHGLPSVQFHLFERNAGSYRFNVTLEYIIGQLLLAGPLAGLFLLWAGFKYKPADRFERALKFSLVGFYVFFLVSTLKSRVEANWTVAGFIPLILLSHTYLNHHPRSARWIYRLAPVTVALVFLARIYMIADIRPFPAIEKDEFHGNKAWANAIHQQAGGLPVVFFDSYQKPSKYWFYSGVPALALNTPNYRRNNYNFWPLEDSLFGKKVFLVGYDAASFANKIPGVSEQSVGNKVVDHYYSFSKLQVTRRHTIDVPAYYLPLFQQFPYDTASLQIALIQDDQLLGYFSTGIHLKDVTQNMPLPETIPPVPAPGNYVIRYAVTTSIPGICTLNSQSFPVSIK